MRWKRLMIYFKKPGCLSEEGQTSEKEGQVNIYISLALWYLGSSADTVFS